MKTGTIIILNGTSSSGKTSILKELQKQLPEPYLDAGIDKFIWMLPKRYLDRPLWDDVLGLAVEAGKTGEILFSGMHHAIAALAKTGNNVVADHVLVEPSWVIECANLFADLEAYLIGIKCPLEVAEEREKQREDRTLGQAKAQYPLVHQHALYDVEIDTSRLSIQESTSKIIEMISTQKPTAFNKIHTGNLTLNNSQK